MGLALQTSSGISKAEILLKNSGQNENQNHHIVDKTPRLIDTVDKGKQI